MKVMRIFLIFTAVLACGIASVAQAQASPTQQPAAPPKPGLSLTTMAFDDGGVVPAKYTQSSPNPVTPDLEWTNASPRTQ